MNTVRLKLDTHSNFYLGNYTDRMSCEYLYDYFDDFIKECPLISKEGDKITARMLTKKIEPCFSMIRLFAFGAASDSLFSQMREDIESEIQKFDDDFKITNLAYDNFAADIRLWTNTENLSVLHEKHDLINEIASSAFDRFANDVIRAINKYVDENLFDKNKLISLLQDYLDFNDNDALLLLDDICNDPNRSLVKDDLEIGTVDVTIED